MELTEKEKKLLKKIKNPIGDMELVSRNDFIFLSGIIALTVGAIVMLLLVDRYFTEIRPDFLFLFFFMAAASIYQGQIRRRNRLINKLSHRIEELEGNK